ncbi:hypothetical protein FB382_001507 [Nocardioides ginsengisegetis]|uniref:Serine/arginine repetitive matrix protein 2 n=1 Tax=Nocardioides ginsengisegetis TaxID=661491 RepID=A0A7W3P9A4_9ACTN|nr:serine/arginine repetitive matrix protein 2 [Nocardioides ginsengisegetis]MBA8803216.1 hypothetical protein [Nocardioides ginsengisegetis]
MSADFRRAEGLRTLLLRLEDEGPDAWRHDAEAADLMRFTIEKYGALARKHGLQPEDAAVAAFEVMRTRAVRTALDPWAVVTRAVQVTLIAEERANGLLCSTSRARRLAQSGQHDAERLSERETPLYEFHPAFRVPAAQDAIELDNPALPTEDQTGAYQAVDTTIALFVALGWPPDTARAALEYVSARLIEAGSRSNAHEVLRRDQHARALLDLDRRAWATLLRVVLGSPNKDLEHTAAGRGLLLRLLIDEKLDELLADDELVASIHGSGARGAGSAHA